MYLLKLLCNRFCQLHQRVSLTLKLQIQSRRVVWMMYILIELVITIVTMKVMMALMIVGLAHGIQHRHLSEVQWDWDSTELQPNSFLFAGNSGTEASLDENSTKHEKNFYICKVFFATSIMTRVIRKPNWHLYRSRDGVLETPICDFVHFLFSSVINAKDTV